MAATDHASQRVPHRRGRRVRRRVRGQCARRRGPAGSLIPHARAVGALVVLMIEAAFRTPPMPAAGRPDGAPAGRPPTARGAVGMAAITRATNREEPVAQPADFLPKRRVHDVGAASRSDWTRRTNRGTTKNDWLASVGAPRRSSGVWRVQLQALTSAGPSPSAYATDPPSPILDSNVKPSCSHHGLKASRGPAIPRSPHRASFKGVARRQQNCLRARTQRQEQTNPTPTVVQISAVSGER